MYTPGSTGSGCNSTLALRFAGPRMFARTRASLIGRYVRSRTSARTRNTRSSASTVAGVTAVTRAGVPSTSHRSNCCQNISWERSSSGICICQRQLPPVANTAVRPRP